MTDIKGIISRLKESIENSGCSYVELEKRTGSIFAGANIA